MGPIYYLLKAETDELTCKVTVKSPTHIQRANKSKKKSRTGTEQTYIDVLIKDNSKCFNAVQYHKEK